MPELPEVETVRAGLAPYVVDARINNVQLGRPNLRFPLPDNFCDRLSGQTIIAARRRAKYLLLDLSKGGSLICHLGMTGSFRFDDSPLAQGSRYFGIPSAQKHDHVVLELTLKNGENSALIYNDPRRFGFMDLIASDDSSDFLTHLGPEPLGNQFNAQILAARLKGSKAPMKSALLNQKVVAGLGNIYVCEALWRAEIDPHTKGAALVTPEGAPDPRLEVLVLAIRDVLEAAIAAGGSTLKDFRNAEGGNGYFQHQFDVYDRKDQPCSRPQCTGTIVRVAQAGRSSFYCPSCQH